MAHHHHRPHGRSVSPAERMRNAEGWNRGTAELLWLILAFLLFVALFN